MDPVSRLRALEDQLSRLGEEPCLLRDLARTWRKLSNPERAYEYARRSVQLDGEVATAWNTLGATLMDLRDWRNAEAAFRQALRLDADLRLAETNLGLALGQQGWEIQEAAQRADWAPFADNAQRLLRLHRARMKQIGAPIVTPFSVLGFHLTAVEQREAAEARARQVLDQSGIAREASKPILRRPGERIRVGYLSADFRNNAAGHLLHRLFAFHDRPRFEVFALSYGPEDGSEFRREIKDGVEHFEDLRDLDDGRAAARIDELGMDLVVDLMGFAGNNRAGILALRPAPRQVSWLGYCMTTGAPWIDAFVGDSIALPPALETAFSEQVLRLPDSYQVYSGQDFERSAARGDFGLPDDAMVYCCFNMPEKIDPAIWARWMDILAAVPGSILWLLAGDEATARNYRSRAESAGVDPARIVPAPLLPKRKQLARVALADLFLDTPLCNAHTTASDSLWAGVPVLTCPGELFAQRVAASVCRAAGLPDLVVDSLDDYVARAIALGNDREALRALKEKLAAAREDAPLFDVPRFARGLEALFETLILRD
jgi:protein O-GlcNAc transferase